MILRNNYRTILKEFFAKRCKKNPRYSLRAYAKDLEISPGRLSNILSEKAGLSPTTAKRLSIKLGLSKKEQDWFMHSVLALDARSKKQRIESEKLISALKKESKKYQELQEDQFKVISDWYHFALLNLIQTKDFRPNLTWIAKRLGVSRVEVDLAIQRLKKLGLLKEERGKLVEVGGNPSIVNDIPSEAIKNFHRQILQKAIVAIDLQSVEERDLSAITLEIPTSILPAAKEKIKEFRREFHSWIETQSQDKDNVYCISIQFFNLTKEI